MVSKFGVCLKKIRDKKNDSLRQTAVKLGISAAFLSAMEIGKKQIPLEYIEKIAEIYNLNENEVKELTISVYETNNKISLNLDSMNQTQKDISIMFARKIQQADKDLLRKLKEALKDENY